MKQQKVKSNLFIAIALSMMMLLASSFAQAQAFQDRTLDVDTSLLLKMSSFNDVANTTLLKVLNRTGGVTNAVFDSDRSQEVTVTVVDMGGRRLKAIQVQLIKGVNVFRLLDSKIASGIYVATLSTDSHFYSCRFMY
jgi:hypothetical protein